MKLKQYLDENGIRPSFFAAKLEATKSQMSLWCSGKIIPRREKLRKIEKLTGGKVKIADWFTEPDSSQTEVAL